MKPFTNQLIQRMAEVIFFNDLPEKSYLDTLKSATTTGDVWGNFVASVYVIKGKTNIDRYRFSLRRVLSRNSSEVDVIITGLKEKAQKHGSLDQSSQEDRIVSNLLATVQYDKTNQVLFDMAFAIVSNEIGSDEYMSKLEEVSASNVIWKEFVKNVIEKKDPRTIASNSKRIAQLFKRKKNTLKLLVKSLKSNSNLEETEVISSDEESEDELVKDFKNQSIHDCDKYEMKNIFTECTKYPADYKKYKFAIDGINLNTISLKTLSVNCWLDDNIVNGFLKLLEFNFENPKILLFDSFFVQNLMSNATLSEPWLKWASKKNLWDDTVWIMPVHQEEPPHWTVLVVAPTKNKIVYLDSLHGALPGMLLHNTCLFMAMFSKKVINWSKWTLHVPKDVPLQTGVNRSTGNCGVHVISWAYIIFSGVATVFNERNMKSVRKMIAHAFVDYASGGFYYSCRRNKQTKNDWRNVEELTISEIKEDRGAGVGPDSIFEFCASLAR